MWENSLLYVCTMYEYVQYVHICSKYSIKSFWVFLNAMFSNFVIVYVFGFLVLWRKFNIFKSKTVFYVKKVQYSFFSVNKWSQKVCCPVACAFARTHTACISCWYHHGNVNLKKWTCSSRNTAVLSIHCILHNLVGLGASSSIMDQS